MDYAKSKEVTAELTNLLIVQEFTDVFPEKILGLPPKRDIDFTIRNYSRGCPGVKSTL